MPSLSKPEGREGDPVSALILSLSKNVGGRKSSWFDRLTMR